MNVKLYDMMFYGVKMVDSLLRENLSYVSQLWKMSKVKPGQGYLATSPAGHPKNDGKDWREFFRKRNVWELQ
jgi:hypothetical protein